MKRSFFVVALGLLFIMTACEEVVDVDLQESEPRLVVEASLLWDQDTFENPLYIQLTTTAPFFNEEVPPAEGAEVRVIREDGIEYGFTEIQPGIFRNEGFDPDPAYFYELEIIYRNEVYRAKEEFISTPTLEFVEQTEEGGFAGDEIELKLFYTDPAGIDNYYLFRFFHERLSLQIYDDEFTDGNQTFAFFSDEDLEPGDDVILEIQGISERFYNYLFILRSQAGTAGGPFQTQPTTVRGNIINLTNPDNFALGYFRLSEASRMTYTIQE